MISLTYNFIYHFIIRSFEPILQLLNVEHTPAVQHWALWTLANLTKVNTEKYCSILREEGGIDVLKNLLMKPGHSRILELAEIVLKQCERYAYFFLDCSIKFFIIYLAFGCLFFIVIQMLNIAKNIAQ